MVYGLGETVLDIILTPGEQAVVRPGGSVLNALVSMGRSGLKCFLISEFAEDQSGRHIGSFLAGNGVDIRHSYKYKDGKTTLALAWLDANREASYSFYRQLPAERMQAVIPDFSPGNFLLYGSFFSLEPEIRPFVLQVLKQAGDAGVTRVYDPNIRPAHSGDVPALLPFIRENMARAHVVRASAADLGNIFPGMEKEEAVNEVRACCPALVLTDGPGKISVFTRRAVTYFGVPGVRVVSTVGAGDSFNAGLIHGMIKLGIHGEDIWTAGASEWKRLVDHALLFSAEVCGSYDNYISRELGEKLKF